MTIKSALKTIDKLIAVKQDIIQAEQELADSWGKDPEDDIPTKTVHTLIRCMQKDIDYLQYIKSQIKHDSKRSKKSL